MDNADRWTAVMDGHVGAMHIHATRAAAEADARWLRRHPARKDRLKMGLGQVVVARVRQCEWTGEWYIPE